MGEKWYGSTTLRTYNGHDIDMLAPEPGDIVLGDIAHALAMSCRFGGHCSMHYSVAEHSVAVADWLRDRGHGEDVQRAGLLHDAAEAYIGDVISPMKRALAALGGVVALEELEARWHRAIGNRFDVCLDPLPAVVHDADQALFEIERDFLATRASGRVELPWYEAEVEFVVAARRLGIGRS